KIIEIPADEAMYVSDSPDFDSEQEEWAFISQKYSYAKDQGKEVGRHQGAHYFTIGQRKGLAVGGTPEPLFVIETDVEENNIYTGQGKNHPGLLRRGLQVKQDEIHWVRRDLRLKSGEKMPVKTRIRYREPLEEAELHQTPKGLYVIFDRPQTAITEGQFVAWYQGDELLGSGVIS